ncbi:DUF1351 domain-containing protein [Schleiferilactobacillus perolens]|jgi:hypothetical protein|uniref:DUF1351 domain-containing protein n=1 Tax=Schleiferilactobacillus perolens TaxID=100468 RepID=UPI0023552C7E|nr:DUF1351 domain-containing protein [Schleiferilactobacillus perolens]MCI2172017.1 DUF1351 domain-containing protein [Schleiferilactobacillus perolens]
MTNINQSTVAVTNFGVSFKPASLAIQNYDAMIEQTKAIAAKYANLMITEQTLMAAKQSRADLRKFRNAIEDKRKEVRREYARPYNDFKSKVDALTLIIDQAITPIDEGVKGLEERQRKERENKVKKEIAEVAESRGLTPDEVELNPTWLNKSISSIERTRQIADIADYVKKKKDQRETDRYVVTQYAKAMDLDAGGWIGLLDQGAELSNVMMRMGEYSAKRKAEEEAERKHQEAQAAIDALHQQKVGDQVVDTETGEVVDAGPNKYSYVIEVSATPEEMDALQSYMTTIGLSWVVK